jgi:NitT/TauT family transport system permease protein
MAATPPPKAPPRRQARPPLWSLRTTLPAGTSRLLSASSIAVLFSVWCVLSYVHVTRNGESTPLVPHFFLPSPDQVLKSLFFLIFEKDLLPAVGVSALRIVKAFGLSLAVALPLGIMMGSFD